MTDITNLLPGNTHITIASISLLCLTSYVLLNTTTTTHNPYSYFLNLINGISISAYVPLILVKLYKRFKLYIRAQISLSASSYRKKIKRESIWRKWINNSEFLLCLTILQFALTCAFISLSTLSLYTLCTITSPHPSETYFSDDHQPSRTIEHQYKPMSSLLKLDDFLPLIFQLIHLIILSIQLISFLLIIFDIRGSLRYSSIDKSLVGLLEKDINDLINLRNENKIPKSLINNSSRIKEKTFGQSSNYNPPYSPIRNINEDSTGGGDGTPRRRSRTLSSNSSIINTPSSVPLSRHIEDFNLPNGNGDNVRFIDPFLSRRSSRNNSNNRRLSVRFDLPTHLNINENNNDKYSQITPSNEYDATPPSSNNITTNKQDYFSLPLSSQIHHHQQKEIIRQIPLSIIKSPKDISISSKLHLSLNPNYSPISNGSDTLQDIIEEEDNLISCYDENDKNEKREDNSWMDVRGDESV